MYLFYIYDIIIYMISFWSEVLMKRFLNHLYFGYIKIISKFKYTTSYIFIGITLFIADIFFIFSEFATFILVQPEALPVILLMVIFIYFWRKLSLTERFPHVTKIYLILCAHSLWTWTAEWVGPSLKSRVT